MQMDGQTMRNKWYPTNVCILQMGMKVAKWAQQSLLLSLGSSFPWVSVAPSHRGERRA